MKALALQVAGTIFLLVALGHLLRVIFKTPASIGSFAIPLWCSAVGAVLAFLLSGWMFKSTK